VRRNPHVTETSSNNLKKSGHIIDTGTCRYMLDC
jgi:hypothetical protein